MINKKGSPRRGASTGGGATPPDLSEQQPPRGLARFWRPLSRPWRVVLVVMPGVAFVIGLAGSTLDLWDKVRPEKTPEPVQIQDVAVTQRGAVDVAIGSVAESGTDTVSFPATDVVMSLNNSGTTAIAFYKLRARVLDAAVLQDCGIAGGAVTVSADYLLKLPEPQKGAARTIDIAWEVPGNSNDRLGVTLGESGSTLGNVPLYQLELELRRGDGTWIDAGRVVVANEIPHYAAFLKPDAEAVRGPDCPEKNRAELTRILSLEGERSAELTAYGGQLRRLESPPPEVVELCGKGATGSIRDIYPIEVVPGDGQLEIATALECTGSDGNVESIIFTREQDAETPLQTYRPSLRGFLMDITALDDSLRLSYVQLLDGGGGRSVEETVTLRNGRFEMIERSFD